MPKLTYTVQGETKTVEVTDSCSIGRLAENTIPLENENGASRRHCQILKISAGFELADLGSTNGTKVNGQKVKRHKLKDGDEIAIGDTVLRWSDGSSAAAEEEVQLEGDVSLEEPAAAPKAASGGSSEQCYLVFAGGPKDGERVALERKRITFGRNAKNTFTFADDMGVSGYHCEIAREGGAYVLRDLGSTNGTLVDGEPVTETALQHGNRVRIGAQRLVFVDPTISDFEKAMAGVEDLGSEWGLLRAEMDMTRVQRARRSQMVGIAFAVAVLAGVGYVALFMPQVWSGGRTAVVPIPGNLVGEDFSFETGTGVWKAAPDSPAVARANAPDDGAAAQGGAFMTVRRDAKGRGAAVRAEHALRVTPDAAYEFGAMVRTKSGAQACVRVVWTSAEGTVVGESATDVVSSDTWKELRGAVPRPPRDGASANLELVNAGDGTACFDDVYFGAAKSKPSTIDLRGGDVSIYVTPDGQATVQRGSNLLLGELSVVGGAAQLDAQDAARRTDRVGSRRIDSVGGSKASGQCFDPASGNWGAFSIECAVDADRFADLTVEMPEGAALVGRVPRATFDQGCSITPANGRATRVSDARAVDAVRSVRFGDRNVFVVSAPEDAPTFRLVLARPSDKSADHWLVAIAAPKLRLRIDTDSAAIRSGVEKLRADLEVARQRRQWGEAVAVLRQVADLLPQGTPEAASSAEEAEKLETGGKTELAAIQAGIAAARDFHDAAELQSLQIRARNLGQLWTGHEIAAGAQAAGTDVQAALDQRMKGLRQRAAVPFLRRGHDYRDAKDYRLAAAIYRGVLAAYPGTEAASEAEKELQALPEGK